MKMQSKLLVLVAADRDFGGHDPADDRRGRADVTVAVG